MNRIFLLILLLIITSFVIWRYKTVKSPLGERKPITVSVSFYPLYYFTSEIAKDRLNIYPITPSGVEPHDYEPTARDMTTVESSRLLIILGGNFEPWAKKILPALLQTQTQPLVLYDKLAQSLPEAEKFDPHLWLSPQLAIRIADEITNALISIDPSFTQTYRKNAQTLASRLTELDKVYRQGLANCLKNQFVTSHAAFGHLANDYNLKQLPIAGLSPETEPSPARLVEISRLVRDNGIKYIFWESLVSPKFAEVIAQETGTQTLVLNPIEGLTASDLQANRDYFTIMKDNLTNLRLALLCQ